ncbi:DUF899 family protein [Sphingomonas sp. BT553]|uniref:DUF899 family protein n=2 Tax=Sphingomonas mollis TaxID=2795726 RepID=A0ABS0XUD2_9SPHN|nr:DUF899 family protein [Sphingomonas sp. BT553]MBJ6123651.1 DUF899 family protein [Sphingomonas sp. BT553]
METQTAERLTWAMTGASRSFAGFPDMAEYQGLIAEYQAARGIGAADIDLFDGKDTLITYFWMYGPERERPCPMCTDTLSGLDGVAINITQRAAFKVLGRSPVSRQLAFARERGWDHLEFVQTLGDDYARDIRALSPEGDEYPSFVVYHLDGNAVRVFYAAEMPKDAADPGQDPRGATDLSPLWNVLDHTPEGRGADWYPKLEYQD